MQALAGNSGTMFGLIRILVEAIITYSIWKSESLSRNILIGHAFFGLFVFSHVLDNLTKGLSSSVQNHEAIFVIFTKFPILPIKLAVFSEIDAFLQVSLHLSRVYEHNHSICS